MKTWVLALMLTVVSFAETWTQKDTLWTCSSGIAIRIPAHYKVEPGPLDSLCVQQDTVTWTFIPATGTEKRQGGIAGLSSVCKERGVQFEPWTMTVLPKAKVRVHKGKTADTQAWLVVFDKGDAHILGQFLMPLELNEQLQTDLDLILNSAE